EARMTSSGYEYQTEFARTHVAKGRAEGRAEGEVKGKADALLAVLEVRGLAITAEQRARIVECTDLAQLDTWVRRAVTVGATSRLFAPTKRAKRAAERKPGEPG
ncbi:MAG TPA: hypothetical protein VFS00_12455, partial [Polyangiaceae bacterium]|nr:hypothetical protein [Polyangiaceae bacterium]